jgi:uncharacterized protein (TIGR03435 family)
LAAFGIAAMAGFFLPGIVSAPLLYAQSSQSLPDSALPSFEVASIKPDNSKRPGMKWSPGVALHTSMTNVTPIALIKRAFGMGDLQISGDPTWTSTKRYDIEADVDESLFEQLRKLPMDQQLHELQLMEQSLLADRFKLKVTHQRKELPLVRLIVTKNISRLGQPADQPLPATPTDGIIATAAGDGELKLAGKNATMDLADVLSRILGQVVENDTGLEGNYTFALSWSEPMLAGSNDGSGPSLQTALEEKLGLKMESTKGPVNTINIDHIEEPSPN